MSNLINIAIRHRFCCKENEYYVYENIDLTENQIKLLEKYNNLSDDYDSDIDNFNDDYGPELKEYNYDLNFLTSKNTLIRTTEKSENYKMAKYFITFLIC